MIGGLIILQYVYSVWCILNMHNCYRKEKNNNKRIRYYEMNRTYLFQIMFLKDPGFIAVPIFATR